MKILNTIAAICLFCLLIPYKSTSEISSFSTGEILTKITAHGTRGSAPFDGKVDHRSDLEDLVQMAWGDGSLGLHRGHAPIINVLEAFLGINHDEMQILMEEFELNLAGVCKTLNLDAENLVATLTASFTPFIEAGVSNGVITPDEVDTWTERIHDEFYNRVHWNGH
ncbi:MAG: hypothetical protein AAGG02_01360 [Cyanobacteria bacterium P01_H01_bin.15]